MSTQYEFMKRQVVEEVAALQEKLIAIQADCIIFPGESRMGFETFSP